MSQQTDLQRQAAQWLVLLSSDDEAERVRAEQDFQHWKQTSPEHAQAAAGMERLLASLRDMREEPASEQRLHRLIDNEIRHTRQQRRSARLGTALGICLVLMIPAWLSWQQRPGLWLLADLDTPIGQWQDTRLADGSRLTLAGGSAVNVHFSATGREVELLRGEIRVEVAADAQRPFKVVTREGSIRALGTRFMVDKQAGATTLSMLESRVLARASQAQDQGLVVSAGQQVRIHQNGLGEVHNIDAQILDQAWQQHRLIARGLPLPDVLSQLERQYAGVLSFDHRALAHIQVFAALPLDNPQRALQLLETTLPIKITRLTPWLIRVQPQEP
ncbi:FecR family protein [Pseudomonas sp. StFLB209]|uniref:FecR family protein n=1 Tax=Pseudomonas sp. StFLB209 TaxID=1028989 RepID=UPI000697EF5A|nr:FecR domain-containing protein [Pseudomonas sp. StFLB209]